MQEELAATASERDARAELRGVEKVEMAKKSEADAVEIGRLKEELRELEKGVEQGVQTDSWDRQSFRL